MDLGLSSTLLAGDPRLVDHIVGQVKSQGIFDQFRKECIADVDTKPAYQNLRTRVEGSVNSFLNSQTWKPDMNKNQLRETLRKNIHEASFLEVGVERIVDQVVNPKIYSVFMPQIEDVVYKFLGIERPKPREKNGPCNLKDLLPKDLDPVSPESDRNSLKDESLESMDLDVDVNEHVTGRKENPPVESKPPTSEKIDDNKKVDEIKKVEKNKKLEDFKKIEETRKVEESKKIDESKKVEENKKSEEAKTVEEIKSEEPKKAEETKNGQFDIDENSMDEFEKSFTKTSSASNLNVSFRSDDKTEEEEESPQFEPIDIMNLNESNLSNDSHLSGISELTSHRSRTPDFSNEFSRDNFDISNHDQDSQLSKVSSNSRLSIVTDFGSSNQASTPFPNANEDSKDRYPKDNFRAIRDIEEGKYKESKFNFEVIKNKESPQEKDKDSKSIKSFSSVENSRDEADILLKEKCEIRDAKEKSESRDMKEKSESRDGKERSESRDGKEKSESSKSRKDKSDSRDSRRHSDRKKQSSSSSSRHSKSRKERDQSREKQKDIPEKTKEVSSKAKEERKEKEEKEKDEKKEKGEKKEKEEKREEKKDSEKQEMIQDIFKDLKDIYKEKIRELREKKELTEKEKLNKDSKTNKDSKERRDACRDKKDYKKDHKTSRSTDRHDKSSKTKSSDSKDKKRDDHRHSKDSRSRSSRNEKESRTKKEGKSERPENKKDTKSESQSSKEKKQRDDKKSKSKDDHSSLRKNSNDRRSTDRDGSNGSNGKSSQKNTSLAAKSVSTTLTKETNNTNNSSGDTSDGIEDSQANDNKLATTEFESQQAEINYKPSTNCEYLYPEKENSLKSDSNSNESCLPLKKRPLYEDSSSPSSSGEPKVKKPKFAKNFHEAKKLMKIRRRMEKQNSEEGTPSGVKKSRTEGTESESLSNSPLPVEDITKVPDEERVQIIEVPDEDCEVPYSGEMTNLTLEETAMIILQGESVGQSDLMQNEYKKESKLSLMEESIRKSLDEMMSDQKLAESSDVAANAERTIETEAQKDLQEDGTSEIEKDSSVKDREDSIKGSEESLIVSEVKEENIEKVSSAENNFVAVKSEEDKVEENLEKWERGELMLINTPKKNETAKLDESLNSDIFKIESSDNKMESSDDKMESSDDKMESSYDKMESDISKIVSEQEGSTKVEKDSKILSPTMELRVSMGVKRSTEDLIRNLKLERSTSFEECTQNIDKKSKKNRSEEKNPEKNLEMKEEILLINDEIEEDKQQGKEYPAASPVQEVCLYFEPDNERYLRFANFLESFVKELNSDKKVKSLAAEKSEKKSEPKPMAPPKLKRKLSSSPLSDILLHNANNNNDGIKEGESETHDESEPVGKKRKLGRPKKQRPSLNSFNPPGLLNGENFIMPLSPESDVSATSEKTSGQPVKEEKSRQRSNQRYSSDDLYKPRPLFSSSSRRNRRSNQA